MSHNVSLADNVSALQAALEFRAHSALTALLAGEIAIGLERQGRPESMGKSIWLGC